MASRRGFPDSQHIGDVSTGSNSQTFVGYAGRDVIFASREDSQEKRQKACRDALYLTNPEIDRANLISSKGKRVPGTCEWIKGSSTYQAWLKTDQSLLWICGGPGKGKTMLSIYLTEELERSHSVVYYFFSANDEKRNNAIALLRGLLWQMTAKVSKLPDQFETYLSTEKQASDTLTSAETLWTMFMKLSREPELAGHAYVIDGLDECNEDSRDWLASKLLELTELDVSALSKDYSKVIVVSRDISRLRQCRKIQLDPDNDEHSATDIRKFISSKVCELSSLVELDDVFRKRVENALHDRAEGTFLWVGFAVTELLKKRTRMEMERTLHDLPRGLSAIYRRMLASIEPRDQQMVHHILQWITLAVRPLSVKELAVAVGAHAMASRSAIEVVQDYLQICSPLVIVRDQQSRVVRPLVRDYMLTGTPDSPVRDPRIGFVHQSVRDYMLTGTPETDAVREAFAIDEKSGHLRLAWSCLDCLVEALSQRGDHNRGLAAANLSSSNALLEYALKSWPSHARRASEIGIELLEHPSCVFSEESFFRDQYCEWYRSYKDRVTERERHCTWLSAARSPARSPALHFASSLGIFSCANSIIEHMRTRNPSANFIDKSDSLGNQALSYAVRGGYESIVRLLIAHAANVNLQARNGNSPLHIAAANGAGSIVRLLLQSGGTVDLTDNTGCTALHRAVSGGHEPVVRLLLNRMARTEVANANGETALHIAAHRGSVEIARLLLHRTARTDIADPKGQTALHIAADHGNVDMTRLLLQHKASVHARAKDLSTALHIAAGADRVEIVALLLDHRSDANALDRYGSPPLHDAVRYGRQTVVRALLKHGASIDMCSRDGRTTAIHLALRQAQPQALQLLQLLLDSQARINVQEPHGWTSAITRDCTSAYVAARNGDEPMLRVLLHSGAFTGTKTENASSILHWAIVRGYDWSIQKLLDDGGNVNAQDGRGRTPLHLAAVWGREAIMRTLLKRRVMEDVDDRHRCTTLQQLTIDDRKEILQPRVKYVADVSIKDKQGRTAYDLAAQGKLEKHKAVAQLLLDFEANPFSRTEVAEADGLAFRQPVAD